MLGLCDGAQLPNTERRNLVEATAILVEMRTGAFMTLAELALRSNRGHRESGTAIKRFEMTRR